MKTDKEFVDAVYEKYGKVRTEEKRREAARRRKFRYIGTIAACIILFVGIIGVTKWDDIKNMGADSQDQEIAVNDTEITDEKAPADVDTKDTEGSDDNTEIANNGTAETDPEEPEPYMTDQGLVNEVTSKSGNIKGIELSKSSGNSISSLFFTDQADIYNVVEWLKSNSDSAMSEATFYKNFSSDNMPDTYFVMSAQFSSDPADSIDVYVVTDTAPGF
ncbi:MAG: hypothetical protein K6D56_03765 [Clostridia bacterium]|nr:hypothetical protein [Clostridia bacterium]